MQHRMVFMSTGAGLQAGRAANLRIFQGQFSLFTNPFSIFSETAQADCAWRRSLRESLERQADLALEIPLNRSGLAEDGSAFARDYAEGRGALVGPVGAETEDRADPRLAALGLAPQLVIEFHPLPAPAAPAAPQITDRRPELPPSDVLFAAGVVLGRLPRGSELALETLGLRITGPRPVASSV